MEETAGTSEVEVEEEREACQHFVPNFLERQTQTNSVGRLKGESVGERRGELRTGGEARSDPGKTEIGRKYNRQEILMWTKAL